LYATQREREGGKRETKSKLKLRVPPATERAASYAKRVQYSDKKQRMNVITKHDSGREVERSGES
jgi:hypothetical protein